jgi:hypothetical protein
MSAIEQGETGLSGIEGALTAIKTEEVGSYLIARISTLLGSQAASVS